MGSLFQQHENPEDTASYAPLVSVGICTRDRTDLLRLALDSLLRQDYSRFEVVVVDNCPSNDDTKRLVADYGLRYTIEPHPGHSWARNRTITECRGEILAFMDDDMIADPRWLSATVEAFADPEVMCVTGLVLPTELETTAQKLFENGYGGYSNGLEPMRFGPDTAWKNGLYGLCHDVGPMMAFRRSVFDKIGVFDVALGAPVGGAEDIDILHRVARAGCGMAYVPQALRLHQHRRDCDGLRRQLAGYGQAYIALLTKCFMFEPDLRLRILKRTVGYGVHGILKPLGLAAIGRSQLPACFALAEGLGALQGTWAYLRSVRRVRRLTSTYTPWPDLTISTQTSVPLS